MHATDLVTNGNLLALIIGGIICIVVMKLLFRKKTK